MLATRLRGAFARTARAFSSSAASVPAAPLPLTVLTDEEESLRSAAAAFARSAVLPHVRAMDAAAQIRPDVFKGLFDGGFMGVEIPQEHGGAGAGFLSACLVVEELAKVDASVAVACDVQNTLVNNVFAMYASAAQRARWQPRLAADTVGSFALSEPSSGSDAFALKTRAVRDGDGWRLSGSKLWITNAEVAGVFLVFATVDPAAGYKGITCFIVERGADGFAVGKPEDKLGIRASSTCPLALDGVRVPAGAVLGEVGKGYKIAIELLNEGRVGIAAQMVGIAQGAFDATQPYLAERKQFGSRIADFQAIQHQVGPEALHGHAGLPGSGQAAVEFGQRGGGHHQQRKTVGKRVLGVDGAGPLALGQALLVGVEAGQAQALDAQEVAEPLRGQRAHVVGLDDVVPDLHPGGLLHGIDGQVQRQHARGAQHHVVVAQAGLHPRHARQFALGQHLAVGVHHHPGAVQVQAGFHQQALTDFEAAAAFHGVQVQGGQGAVKVAHRAQEWVGRVSVFQADRRLGISSSRRPGALRSRGRPMVPAAYNLPSELP
jgi:alkylation response protein AidB-like acyl-CoA dehydrogenase